MFAAYILDINPEPWAIGTAFAHRGGRGGAGISPNAKLQTFKQAVGELLQADYNPAMVGPDDRIVLEFYFSRNTGPITTTAKTLHPKIADATNLQKALEDALQDILFPNDQKVTRITSTIVDQGPNVKPEIIILMRTMDAELGRDLGDNYNQAKAWTEYYKPTAVPQDTNEW